MKVPTYMNVPCNWSKPQNAPLNGGDSMLSEVGRFGSIVKVMFLREPHPVLLLIGGP